MGRNTSANSRNYIITAAQYNAGVHKSFLETLKQYADRNDAELIVLPMAGKTIADDTWPEELDGITTINRKRQLNSNILIDNFSVRPQQIDPVTGLARFAQNNV